MNNVDVLFKCRVELKVHDTMVVGYGPTPEAAQAHAEKQRDAILSDAKPDPRKYTINRAGAKAIHDRPSPRGWVE